MCRLSLGQAGGRGHSVVQRSTWRPHGGAFASLSLLGSMEEPAQAARPALFTVAAGTSTSPACGHPGWAPLASGPTLLPSVLRWPQHRGVAAAGRAGCLPAAQGRPRRRHSRTHLHRAAALASAPLAAAMQETNAFLLSALQPEAGVCSLALPSDRQLDGRSREAAEAQRLRSARVQEQVRIRMMLRGQAAAPRPEAAVLDPLDGRGGKPRGGSLWAGGSPFPLISVGASRLGAEWLQPAFVVPTPRFAL